MVDLKYRRILLKISGEALAGEQEYGLSAEVVRFIADEVQDIHRLGVQIGMVIGGGYAGGFSVLDAATPDTVFTLPLPPAPVDDITTVFRFGNGIFEPVWNRNYIDHVQITVAETLGVEGRGDYYDDAGAVRDMIQNHLLQLMALVAMEPPNSLDGDDVRGEKLKLLKSIGRVEDKRVGEVCVRGQYVEWDAGGMKVPAYRAEKKVPPGSFTETYAAFRLSVDNWRWAGVPFYLRTGKRMARKVSEIAIQFRPAPSLLFKGTECGRIDSNLLVINIQPDEGIFLRFSAKEPGPGVYVRPVDFHFTYREAFGARSTPAYGRLLLDVMHGDPTLFPREEDVETSWALLDPFLRRWESDPGHGLRFYPAGGWGPPEADTLLEGGRDKWRRP